MMGRKLGGHNQKSVKERFLEKIDKTFYCWLWNGSKSNHLNKKFHYGLMRIDHKNIFAHRISYSLFCGEIPKGMCVLHKCDTPLCVRPSHLWIGTQLENIQDRTRKGRTVSTRGENNHLSKLTKDNVLEIRSLYASGKHTQVEIGRMFNVTHRAIGKIIARENWKHVQ